MPKVSIIVSVYNMEKYLRQCLDSCINQTLKDIEIICVNDGSTDNCPDIIKEYAIQDARIKIINQENQGLAVARNNGFDIAIGEFVLFLDSDDSLELNASEAAYNQAVKNGNDFLLFNYYTYIERNGKCLESKLNINKLAGNNNINLKETENLDYVQAAYVWNKIYKREWLIKNNIKFIKMEWEDLPFTIQTILHSESMSVIKAPLLVYRLRENSLTKKCSPEGAVKSKDLALCYILEAKNKKLLKIYLNYYFKSLLHWYDHLKMDKNKKAVYEQSLFMSFKRIEDIDFRAKLYKFMIKTHTFVIYRIINKTEKIIKWICKKIISRGNV